MRILGIDPGTATTGYGIIKVEGNRISIVDLGTVKTHAKDPLPKRLKTIYDGILAVVEEYRPDACSIENIFMHENARTAIILGHSRAVALMAVINNEIPVYEYTPREIKQSVVGNGNASKEQVQYMIRMLLNLKEIPKPSDAADGCAAAICHFNHLNSNRIKK
ncbi:MAG: crossover junction endodeoxyribonuclease RuvC [Calditrichaeota bacterium]|nr:crossover junction endodeoxyribonuclease RuvC [Calditrichota bacterium]